MKKLFTVLIMLLLAFPIMAAEEIVTMGNISMLPRLGGILICDRDEDGNIDKIGVGCIWEAICEAGDGTYAASDELLQKTDVQYWGCFDANYCNKYPNMWGCS